MTNEVISYPDPLVWNTNEPDFGEVDSCVFTMQHKAGKYSDAGCNILMKYICQVYWGIFRTATLLWCMGDVCLQSFRSSSYYTHSNRFGGHKNWAMYFWSHAHLCDYWLDPASIHIGAGRTKNTCSSFYVHQSYLNAHVGRQRKGSIALIMGLFPASFALAWVSPSFGLIPHWK